MLPYSRSLSCCAQTWISTVARIRRPRSSLVVVYKQRLRQREGSQGSVLPVREACRRDDYYRGLDQARLFPAAANPRTFGVQRRPCLPSFPSFAPTRPCSSHPAPRPHQGKGAQGLFWSPLIPFAPGGRVLHLASKVAGHLGSLYPLRPQRESRLFCCWQVPLFGSIPWYQTLSKFG